jgi:hypothetical protein
MRSKLGFSLFRFLVHAPTFILPLTSADMLGDCESFLSGWEKLLSRVELGKAFNLEYVFSQHSTHGCLV